MKKINPEKLKNGHVLPSIFFLLIITVLINATILAIGQVAFMNMVREKIVQGNNWANGLYIKACKIGFSNELTLNTAVEDYREIVPDITGLYIKDDEKSYYSYGDTVSDDNVLIDLENVLYSPGETAGIKIFIDPAESSDFTRLVDGDGEVWFEAFRKIMLAARAPKADRTQYFEMPVVAQKCWYCFEGENGKKAFVGYVISISTMDCIYGIIICLGLIFVCFAFCVLTCFFIIRFSVNQKRAVRLYYSDVETGGFNWSFFEHVGNKVLKRNIKKNAKRNSEKKVNIAVVHIHMEKYRNYCSCYGHDEGRKLLSDFYDAIRKMTSKKEMFARHDMADFGLMLIYQDDIQLKNRVKGMIDRLDQVRPNIKMYFQAGIYRVDAEKLCPTDAYNRASTARAKLGDDHVENINFFTDSMKEELLWEAKVENEMDRALANHEFQVYLQPKYSVGEEKLAAAEALVRWVHPIDGLIAPYKFIPIFEENGFILKLDDYMITEVAKLQAKWLSEGKSIVPISVNVSRAHFTDETLAEHICDIIDAYSVPHDFIELELTESAFFDDKKVLIDIVNRMKSHGFSVSMDDFGAGYSSLNSLKELPIDIVKLDAGFFRGEDEEGKGKVIVTETIKLAKKLNMKIVAEGIETREQVDFLAERDCDLIQGYYFAKPMPVDEFVSRAF